MRVIKRLILVAGYIPCFLMALALWIATGKDPLEMQDRFIIWCLN